MTCRVFCKVIPQNIVLSTLRGSLAVCFYRVPCGAGVFAGFPNGVLYDVSLRHIVQCTRVECPVERFCRMPIQVVPVIRRMYLWSEVHMQIRVYPLEHTLEGILPEHTYDSPSALIVSRRCF